tara:strand:- start:5 stop:199 length:195 start_codon:yes stop_codon:yes gene_type:complete
MNIFEAVENGDLERVKKIIEEGFNTRNEHLEIIEYLETKNIKMMVGSNIGGILGLANMNGSEKK